MARARNIKPSFFKNEDLSDMDTYARLLFIGLWCLADREGILEDRPKRIKGELFPYENVDVDKLLQALHEKGFILRYTADEQGYIFIPNFAAHQNPHHREAPSKYPKPKQDEALSNKDGKEQGKPDASLGLSSEIPYQGEEEPAESRADSLIPDSLNLIPDSPLPITKSVAAHKKVVVVGGRELHVFSSVIDLYQHYFVYQPNAFVIKLLNSYLDDGMKTDSLAWAMRDAAEKGKQWTYAKGTIENLFQKGIRTAEQAEAADQEFKKKREHTVPNKVIPLRSDKLPESVQRQLEREQKGLPVAVGEKATVMDDPELRQLLESARKRTTR